MASSLPAWHESDGRGRAQEARRARCVVLANVAACFDTGASNDELDRKIELIAVSGSFRHLCRDHTTLEPLQLSLVIIVAKAISWRTLNCDMIFRVLNSVSVVMSYGVTLDGR